jgi:hypothetical protein
MRYSGFQIADLVGWVAFLNPIYKISDRIDISNRLFSNHNWFFKILRRSGLLLLQTSPLKWVLMYFMMGLH